VKKSVRDLLYPPKQKSKKTAERVVRLEISDGVGDYARATVALWKANRRAEELLTEMRELFPRIARACARKREQEASPSLDDSTADLEGADSSEVRNGI
jgi:hypothetical protein